MEQVGFVLKAVGSNTGTVSTTKCSSLIAVSLNPIGVVALTVKKAHKLMQTAKARKANLITVFVGGLKELGHVEYQRKSTDGEQKFDDSFPQSIDVISGIAVVDGVMNCHVPEISR